MCGVNGIFAYHYAANDVDRRELIATRDHMVRRGPDGAGEWLAADGRLGLGHRRLAVTDLTAAAAQPMARRDDRAVLVFNGEIYNWRELRRGLEQDGVVFESCSDTEVLLHLYDREGEAMVERLRGMFALALWDARERGLLLARDPHGIKPLYWSDDGWTLRFASQVKALLAGGGVSRERDPAGLAGFALFGHVPEPHTTYAAVRSLPAGATMWVDRSGPHTPRRYWCIAAVYRAAEQAGPASRGAAERLQEAIRQSVQLHARADVPTGVLLSAGVDSGALAALMAETDAGPTQTVTVAFADLARGRLDEAPAAAAVAAYYGTDHVTRIVTAAEIEADLDRILTAMDQPSIDGINMWFAAKAARERGLKVAIAGLGGDELLGGYPSFRDIPRWVHRLAPLRPVPLLGRVARMLAVPLAAGLGLHPKAPGMLELGGSHAGAYLLKRGLFMPWELDRVLGPDVAREGLRRLAPLRHVQAALAGGPMGSFARVAVLEASLYMRNQLLRDADWAAMAHSIEVRVPLVDRAVIEAAAAAAGQLALGAGKQLLAATPRRPLPKAIVERPKTGFTTPHLSRSLAPPPPGAAGRTGPGDRCGGAAAARAWSSTIARLALAG